jgi:hypothetical protein
MKKLILLTVLISFSVWGFSQTTTNFPTPTFTGGSANPEGFWTSGQGNWTISWVPASTSHWSGGNNVGYVNDPVAAINGNSVVQGDTLKCPAFAIPADVAYTYSFTFDWRNPDFRNSAGGTVGTLGSGDVLNGYNMSDLKVVIYDGSTTTWTTVWTEDNKTSIPTNTVEALVTTKAFVWPTDFTPGSAQITDVQGKWYRTTINLDNSLRSKTIRIAFIFISASSGTTNRFYIDNFNVKRYGPYTTPYLVFKNYIGTPYTAIPHSQVNSAGYTPVPWVRNAGIAITTPLPQYEYTVDASTKATAAGTALAMYDSVQIALKNASNNTYVFKPAVKSGPGTYSSTTYSFGVKETNTTSPYTYLDKYPKSLLINATSLSRFTNSGLTTLDLSTSSNFTKYGGQVGTEFTTLVKDHLVGMNIDFGTAGAPFDVAIVNSTGTVIYQGLVLNNVGANTSRSGNTPYTFLKSDNVTVDTLILDPATYYVLVRQTTSTALQVKYDADLGEFWYYSGTILTKESAKGDLAMSLNFVQNRTPKIFPVGWNYVTGGTYPAYTRSAGAVNVYAGEEVSFSFLAYDQDGESVSFKKQTGNFVPSWLTVTDNGNNTFTVKGTPAKSNIANGQSVTVYMTDGIDTSTVTVSVNVMLRPSTGASFNDGLNAQFTGAFPSDWWQTGINKSASPVNWKIVGGIQAKILGDATNDQDETLFTRPMFIPNTGADTVYYFSFDWNNDYANNCSNSGNDFADITVSISKDFGTTWTSIWQDDDQTSVLSGKPFAVGSSPKAYLTWPYNGATTYTSEYDMKNYKGQHVMFKFNYKGKNGGAFILDNVKLERITAAASLNIASYSDYNVVPFKHRSANNFSVRLINTTKVQMTAVDNLQGYIDYTSSNIRIYTGNLSVTGVPINDTSYVKFTPTLTYWMKNAVAGTTTSLNLNCIWAPTPTPNPALSFPGPYLFKITQDNGSYFARDNDGQGAAIAATESDYNALGTDFTLVTEDYLKKVSVFCSATGNTNVSISVYKNTGTALEIQATYSSSTFTLAAGPGLNHAVYTLNKPLKLAAGNYIVFIQELSSSNPVNVYTESTPTPNSYFYRGKGSAYRTVIHKGYLFIRPWVYNEAPSMTTGILTNANELVAYESKVYSAKLSAFDKEGSTPKYLAFNLPSWMTLTDNNDGTALLSGTPAGSNVGMTNFQVRLTDGADTSSAYSYVFEVKGNPAPYFTSTPVTEAKQGAVYTYNISAKDMFGEALTLTALTKPSWLTFTANNSAGTAVLSGTPAASDVGVASVQIQVTDAVGKLSTQIFNVIVSSAVTVNENKPPTFTSTPILTAQQGVAYSYSVVATDANTTDVLTIGVAPGSLLPGWLTLTAGTTAGTATLAGTPTVNNVGENQVILTVSDGKAIVEQSFRISVRAVNNIPVISSTPVTTAKENIPYLYSITTTHTDNNQNVVISGITIPSWLQLINTGGGKASLEGTPRTENVGNSNVKIVVSDGLDTVSQQFVIVVSALTNTAPAFSSTAVTAATQDQSYTYNITATDADGQALRFSARALPAWLSLVDYLNGSAKLSGTPGKANVGAFNITLTVTDGKVITEQNFKITVAASGKGEEVVLYPNPNNGSLTITNTDKATIYLFNSNGKMIGSYKGSSIDFKIDINKFTSGTYLLKLIREDGTIVNKTFNLIK